MSENEKNIQEQESERAAGQATEQATEQPAAMTPVEAAEAVASGKFKLLVPIVDGEQEYAELRYDFNKLTGWELARAIDSGADRNANPNSMTDVQALSLFAAAAAKATGGLDAQDIKDRMSAMDAIAAISVASIFFRGSLLAGSLRITKE